MWGQSHLSLPKYSRFSTFLVSSPYGIVVEFAAVSNCVPFLFIINCYQNNPSASSPSETLTMSRQDLTNINTSTGYENLALKGYGFACDFRASTWPTYKSNVLKWAEYEEDARLATLLSMRFQSAVELERGKIMKQIEDLPEGKGSNKRKTELEKLLDQVEPELSQLRKKIGRMFLRTLGPQASSFVATTSDPYEIWMKLIARFEGVGAPTNMTYWAKISRCQYNPTRPISGQISYLESLFSALEERGEKLSEVFKISALMNSLRGHEKYSAWMAQENAQASQQDNVASWSGSTTRLLSISQLGDQTRSTSNSSFMAQSQSRNPHQRKVTGNFAPKGTSECFNCKKMGSHFARDCRGKCMACKPNPDGHSRAKCPKNGNPGGGKPFSKSKFKKKPRTTPQNQNEDDDKDDSGFVAFSYMVTDALDSTSNLDAGTDETQELTTHHLKWRPKYTCCLGLASGGFGAVRCFNEYSQETGYCSVHQPFPGYKRPTTDRDWAPCAYLRGVRDQGVENLGGSILPPLMGLTHSPGPSILLFKIPTLTTFLGCLTKPQ